MSTAFTVSKIVRDPHDETMFADLGVPWVDFGETTLDGRVVQTVTVPIDLTDADILRARIRLLTATASAEATLVAAVDALVVLDQVKADALAYAAIPSPTSQQAVAATTQLAAAVAQLAGDVHGLIEWVGRDALDLGH